MMDQKQQQRGFLARQKRGRISAPLIRLLLVSSLSLAAVGLAVHFSISDAVSSRVSKAFLLQDVDWQEVGQSNLSVFVTPDLLWQVSGLQKGAEVLRIKLSEIEDRLLSIPWIESVQIQKKLPSSLLVQYTVHQARAFAFGVSRAHSQNQTMWFVSSDGELIAPASESRPEAASDLPVIFYDEGDTQELQTAVEWLNAFDGSWKGQVYELRFAPDRIMVLTEIAYQSRLRKVELWLRKDAPPPEGDESVKSPFVRLQRLARYLIKNNILVSSIDLRPEKKIVVNVGKRP